MQIGPILKIKKKAKNARQSIVARETFFENTRDDDIPSSRLKPNEKRSAFAAHVKARADSFKTKQEKGDYSSGINVDVFQLHKDNMRPPVATSDKKEWLDEEEQVGTTNVANAPPIPVDPGDELLLEDEEDFTIENVSSSKKGKVPITEHVDTTNMVNVPPKHVDPGDEILLEGEEDFRVVNVSSSKKGKVPHIESFRAYVDDIEIEENDDIFRYRDCEIATVVFREAIMATVCPPSTLQDVFKESTLSGKDVSAEELEQTIVQNIKDSVDYANKAFGISPARGKQTLEVVCEYAGFLVEDIEVTGTLFHPHDGHFKSPENRINYFTRHCQDRLKSIVQAHEKGMPCFKDAFPDGESGMKARSDFEMNFFKGVIADLELGIRTEMSKPEMPPPEKESTMRALRTRDHATSKVGPSSSLLCCFGSANVTTKDDDDIDDEYIDKHAERTSEPLSLDFQTNAPKLEALQKDDLEKKLLRYIVLLKVLIQHENPGMVTPEITDNFVFDFTCVNEMEESMHFHEPTRSNEIDSRAPMEMPLLLTRAETRHFYKNDRGQHALKPLSPAAMRLLHNVSLYYGLGPIHETLFRTFVLAQNFRGAVHEMFQPQLYMRDHIQSTNLSIILLNQLIENPNVLSVMERGIIQKRVAVSLETSIDSSILHYQKLFPIGTGGGIERESPFGDILHLNIRLYHLMHNVSEHAIDSNHGEERTCADDCMWNDVQLKLKSHSENFYHSLRPKSEENTGENNWWEFKKLTSPIFYSSTRWIRFGAEDAQLLHQGYLGYTSPEVQLSAGCVDMRTFAGELVDIGKVKIRGVVNGTKAQHIKSSVWDNLYSIIIAESTIPFSVSADPTTKAVIVDRVDDRKQGGMEVGDHLAFIDDWPCVGQALTSVYQRLASATRPFTIRLVSNRTQETEESIIFEVRLKPKNLEGKLCLGLHLGDQKSQGMTRVLGFERMEKGAVLPAEASNQIRQDDLIWEINGVNVSTPSVSHATVLELLNQEELTLKFKRDYQCRDGHADSRHSSITLSASQLTKVIDECLEKISNDKTIYAPVAKTTLAKYTSLVRRRGLDCSIAATNVVYLYDCIVIDVQLWLKEHPVSGSAANFPEGILSLYKSVTMIEAEFEKLHGESWHTKVMHDFDSCHSFGQYINGWIEQSYVHLSEDTIPRYFSVETWNLTPGSLFPWSSNELIYLTNNLIEGYTSLPNHEDVSNVVRFGKENICELFCSYCRQVKDSFRVASLEFGRKYMVEKVAPEDQQAFKEDLYKLCHRINSIFRCYDGLLDVLVGLNQVQSIDGFLDEAESSDEERNSSLSRASSKDWGDHFDDNLHTTHRLIVHRIRVRVLEARELRKVSYGWFAASDPYVQMRVYEQQISTGCWFGEAETQVAYSTQHPVWNENFEFTAVRRNAKLHLLVLDHESRSKTPKIIGETVVGLKTFYYDDGVPHEEPVWLPLLSVEGKPAGEIKMLIVSRQQDLGGSAIRRMNGELKLMLGAEEWGLVECLRNKVIRLIDTLLYSENHPLPDRAEDIDEDLVDARLDALYECISEYMMPWCSALHEICFAKVLVRLWRMLIETFIQFLLPTLDRAYPYCHMVHLRVQKKRSSWFQRKKMPTYEERVDNVTYLNDAQVKTLRLAYGLLAIYLQADGSESGLKAWLGRRELGDEFLMLCQMRDALEQSPEQVTAKVGRLLGEMIDASNKAKQLGWDSRFGHMWEDLRNTKLHFHHLLLYGASIAKNDTVAKDYLNTGLFVTDEITRKGVGYQEGQAW